jgi:hypothetical protein
MLVCLVTNVTRDLRKSDVSFSYLDSIESVLLHLQSRHTIHVFRFHCSLLFNILYTISTRYSHCIVVCQGIRIIGHSSYKWSSLRSTVMVIAFNIFVTNPIRLVLLLWRRDLFGCERVVFISWIQNIVIIYFSLCLMQPKVSSESLTVIGILLLIDSNL